MTRSELQREYTLAQALADIAIGGAQDDTAKVERASEWVGRHVAELQAKADAATRVERVVVAEVRTQDTVVVTVKERLSDQEWLAFRAQVEAELRRATWMPDLRVAVLDGGADVSVLRPAKVATTTRSTRATSASVWEELPAGETVHATFAPDHQAGVAAPPGQPTCTAPHPVDGEPRCALAVGHFGRHCDLTAVAHAGKAGEVWE